MFRMSRRAAALFLLLLPFSVVPAALAQADPPSPAVNPDSKPGTTKESPVPPDAVLEGEGAVIGDVVLHVGDVFDPKDPKEDHLLFRLANRLHRNTRDEVIERQLLFKPGDLYSRHAIEESERILRQNRYLYDAKIRPVRYGDGRVDLEVATRDVWTLNVGAGLGRSGGTNSTHLQLQDTNFLGTGKSITLEQQSDVDRTTSLFRYDDPALLGSHARLSVGYDSNSDGSFRNLEVGQPFYSLETRWSALLTASSGDRVESLYELGHSTDRFHHLHDLFQVQGGLSQGLVNGWTNRWTGGFTYLRDRFEAAEGFATPEVFPENRTLSYPWIAWDAVEDKFLETRDTDQIERTEDFHLGSRLHLRVGWASPLFGSDRNVAVVDGNAGTGFRLTPTQTLLLASDLSGRWGRDDSENALLHGSARYYWRDFGEHLFFATLEGDVGSHLFRDNQLLLGGDSGLRGYPLRYQDGDERLLLTLEQRFFTDYYPFQLVHVGGAVFFDVGRTWPGASAQAPNLGWLRDIGVGLRLSSSRSGLGNVVHIDLAFPLDGDGSIQSMQWLVRTKSSF
jgi:hemolysin activation/secretion protein